MFRRHWPLLLLAALPVVVFADVVFGGANFFYRDLYTYHYPMKKIVREVIESGEFPFWTRLLAGGQPLAANPAWEIFYPPQLLIFIGSYDRGFAIHIFVHVVVALLGMYALCRELLLGRAAAWFGALSFGLGAFFIASMTTLPTFFVWSWAPLAGCAALRLLRDPSPRRFAVAALVLAMATLVGEPMSLLQVWALVGVAMVMYPSGNRPRSALLFAGLVIAVAALAAVQLVPGADHAADSKRALGFSYEDVVDRSMDPGRPLEMIVSRFSGDQESYLGSLYAGLAVAILGLAGIVRRLPGTIGLLVLSAVSYVMAIGGATPLYRLLYDWGLARSLRYPEKFIAAAVVVWILFAAVVADRLLAGDRALWKAARFVSLGVLAVTLVVGSGVLVAAGWAVVLWSSDRIDPKFWKAAVVVLLLFDVVWKGRSYAPSMPRWFFTPPAVVEQMPGDRDRFNIFHRGMWRIYDPNFQKAKALSVGFTARNSMTGLTPATWGFRNVLQGDFDETFLIPTHELIVMMKRHAQTAGVDWDEPFIAISNVRYVLEHRDLETALAEVQGDLRRVRPLAVIRRPNRGPYYFPGRTGRVIGYRETANTATIDVVTPAPARLYTAVTQHKYWSAMVDGREVPIEPANIAYQSIAVPAGRHRIEMRYFNPLVVKTGFVSVAALAAMTVMILIPRRRHPRTGP